MEHFNIWAFLGGLAMFVFGMDILEDTIKQAGYDQLKKFLSKTVNTNLRAIFAGTILAGVLQSGTIVSVMVLSFVGAGILSLSSAVGVIIGANVGGTFLSVIIAKLGFGYSISVRALPLLSIGGILQFIKNKRVQLTGQLILSFGLLLFGIGYLKDSVSILAHGINVAQYASMGRYVFFFGGIVLAAIIHSSGTATIIAMTAMQSGILTFEQAVIVMLGASIGSSLISLYASAGGGAAKKQVAYSHVFFNALGGIGFLFLVPFVEQGMGLIINVQKNGPDALAIFQVIYNVVTAIIIYPFITPLTQFLGRFNNANETDYQLSSIALIKMSDSENQKTLQAVKNTYNLKINNSDIDKTIYLQALESDIVVLLKKVFKFNVHQLNIDQKILLNPDYTISEKYYGEYALSKEDLDEDYDIIKTIESSILSELFKQISIQESEKENIYFQLYEIIENIIFSAKILHDTRHNFNILYFSDNLIIKERIQTIKKQMIDLYLVFSKIIKESAVKTYVNDLKKMLIEVNKNDTELTAILGQHINRQKMPGAELTSLLHLTSALERSHDSFLKALSLFYGESVQK